ncbi:MAG: transcriptional repressor [Candidatus Levybacteria bacterium]|nr:transcriptional repressor [Candidatus Levybacteria bacterium]
MQILHDCSKELNKLNLKATPARLAVLRLLENSREPIDVSSIIRFLKKNKVKADPATVFRIVNLLTQKGVLKQVRFNEDKFRYEYGLKNEHHHLICQSCGEIEDMSDCPIDSLKKEIHKKKKFIIKTHSLEFFGICKNCQS